MQVRERETHCLCYVSHIVENVVVVFFVPSRNVEVYAMDRSKANAHQLRGPFYLIVALHPVVAVLINDRHVCPIELSETDENRPVCFVRVREDAPWIDSKTKKGHQLTAAVQ